MPRSTTLPTFQSDRPEPPWNRLKTLSEDTRDKMFLLGFFGLGVLVVVLALMTSEQSSRAAATGYDISALKAAQGRLEREEQRLTNRSAELQSYVRIERDAVSRLEMVPAVNPEYVRAQRSPIDIDGRLRAALSRTQRQAPTLLDGLFDALLVNDNLPGAAFEDRVDTTAAVWSALTSGAPASPVAVRTERIRVAPRRLEEPVVPPVARR